MINILISADSRYQVDKDFLRQVTISALQQRRVKGKIEVSIAIVGDRAMTDLNRKYQRQDKTCDVLAFPQQDTTPARQFGQSKKVAGFVKPPDKILRLGDIVISHPQALSQAVASGIPIEEELQDLTEHAIDHLLGMHHD